MISTDENKVVDSELVQLARLAVAGTDQDVRLYVARLVRKHRTDNPELSDSLNKLLKDRPEGRSGVLRKEAFPQSVDSRSPVAPGAVPPSFLFGPVQGQGDSRPLLALDLESQLLAFVREHKEADKLLKAGLRPSSSMVFVGRPGVGKTLTARWLAEKLELPMFILDLATVMSSYLGQTGSNLKAALAFAKETPSVLLLDEIDALAKRRADDSDVGEVKRIVTVMLQEIERWPSRSLLIAATNHPELVDPALWRRFDHVFEFEPPSADLVKKAIRVFLGPDWDTFSRFEAILTTLLLGSSFSDIERQILRFRRALVVGDLTPSEIIGDSVKNSLLDKKARLDLAKALLQAGDWSQHKVNELTGVSRDTLRKYKET